jgi:ribose/xylose/arabinose/galactoside ABC-type transport system permease subunit
VKALTTLRYSIAPSLPSRVGRRLLASEYFVLLLTLVYFLVLLPFVPRMASGRNFANIFSNLWPLLAVAMGQTFVLIVAGIDLSQTSVMALTSVIGAVLITQGVNPELFSKSPLWGVALTPGGGVFAGAWFGVPAAIAAMLLAGAVIGMLNGAAVAYARMPAFMVTFVGFMFYDKVALYLTKSENIMNLPGAFIAVSKGSIGFVPVALLVSVSCAVAAHFLMGKTVFGKWLYATGINPKTSLISGVPTARVIVGAYMISGICAAVASVLYTGRLECGRPTLGSSLLLDIVGANIIGGISLFGGKGRITWTFFGVLFFVVLGNSLSMMNLDAFAIDIVKGCVILCAAVLDVLRSRMAGRAAH